MAYTTLSNGSRGDGVKELQQKLIDAGYDLGKYGADGIYGSITANAVKEYQKANGLYVDGIAGNKTLTHLYETNTQNSTTTPSTPTNPSTPSVNWSDVSNTYSYDKTKDEAYNKALAALNAAQANKPTYSGSYDKELDALYNKITNRQDFKFDINKSALYDQYKQQYVHQGQMAMQDAMAQASNMTGGYGNSYAASAGQQTYQAYLQRLNEKVPEIYQAERAAYDAEGDRLAQNYSLTRDMASQEYDRYNNALSNYYAELDRAQQQEAQAYERGYNEFLNNYKLNYTANRDNIADEQWKAEMDRQEARDEMEDYKWGKEYELALKQQGVSGSSGIKSNGSSGSSSGGSSSSSNKTFTGSDYNSAKTFITSNGGSATAINGMMTEAEWNRQKAMYMQLHQGPAAVKNYSSYAAYLKSYVNYATGK